MPTQSPFDRLRALHAGPGPVLLGAAWDVGTGRLAAHLGYPGIDTSSAGLAFSTGRPDAAGLLTRDEIVGAFGAIARAVDVPVPVLVVNDVTVALARLATEFRRRFAPDCVWIGVAGANGKTTTKELVAAACAAAAPGRVHATRRNLTGKINAVIEDAGLRIVAQKRIRLSDAQAKKFYEVHKDRPFYGELVSQMTAEPVVVQVLEGENAVPAYRAVMGATNPKEAADGTIRKLFALSIGENSVHGSDSPENAQIEIAQFFTDADIVG